MAAALVAALVLVTCNTLFGVDELSYDGAPGGSAPPGGSGGQAAAGTAGNGYTGGLGAAGGTGGVGAQGGIGGASGGGGVGGAGGELPVCAAACPEFCADLTAPISVDCARCIEDHCREEHDRFVAAPALAEFLDCLWSLDWDECCSSYTQPCLATVVLLGCACGHSTQDCTDPCADACSGGDMNPTCQECVVLSPCGMAYYDYAYHPHGSQYSQCRSACGGDPSCEDYCCATFPVACDLRAATIACVCG